ncbi:MAG TPA: riboflavin kinase [Candidatus Paenibacillus intestinavium]|nr:riboflavin kinase [Candidatus Paenibacillus intestinavium]
MSDSFYVIGEVVHGNALGRELMFPTINLGGNVDQYASPKAGIYLGIAEIMTGVFADQSYYTLISAGYRPTVNGDSYKIEAYLLDFSGDLYGEQVKVIFSTYLREEIKFDNLDDLIVQMKLDEQNGRAMIVQGEIAALPS